tara:strand:- start:659 stop:901 length:243 start_codon:yes stop_codon:yes gene_type:complete
VSYPHLPFSFLLLLLLLRLLLLLLLLHFFSFSFSGSKTRACSPSRGVSHNEDLNSPDDGRRLLDVLAEGVRYVKSLFAAN